MLVRMLQQSQNAIPTEPPELWALEQSYYCSNTHRLQVDSLLELKAYFTCKGTCKRNQLVPDCWGNYLVN